MSRIIQTYGDSLADCRHLRAAAVDLSLQTTGLEAPTRNVEVASWIFAKITSHAHAIVELSPVGPLGGPAPEQEFWDLASVAVLTRALIDAYYTLFYIAIDPVDEDLRDFRWLLWDHHAVLRRLEQLALIGSVSPELPRIQADCDNLAEQIANHPIYLKQTASTRKKLRNGDLGIFATNSDLSVRAGVDPNYYKAAFMFLSSYVHAHPLSLSQLALFRAGDDESLRTLSTVIRYAVVYLALSIRDFRSIIPECSRVKNDTADAIVSLWTGIAREFSKIKSEARSGYA